LTVRVGIDEAGYGPVVGPLVVSASVFAVPDELGDACLWRVLAGAVTRRGIRKSPALPVADSKTMHVRSDGPVHIERGVLGMLALLGPMPGSLRDLLRRVAPEVPARLGRYPWYADADPPLPLWADAQDIRLRARGVSEAMRRTGASLRAIRAEIVLTGEYNRLVRATRNKSVALFGVTSRLIARAFADDEASPIRITVDRLGGRRRYLSHLQRMFPGGRIRILEESEECSAYRIHRGPGSAELRFRTGAENASLPVALASMVSKYLREVFMEMLNRWWAGRIGPLKPTAGYYVDGQRFLKDIDRAVSADGIDRDLLVRCR